MAEADVALTASRALLGVIARSLAGVLEIVTLPQFRVLVILTTAGPVRMGRLSEQMGILPSTFSRSVDRMVAQGWVRRQASPESRREVLIDVTDLGRSLVETVSERRQRDMGRILSMMTPEAQATLLLGLEAFSEAAGETTTRDLLTLGV